MNNLDNLNNLNKQAIAKSFSIAAKTYDQAAILQQEVGTRLLERLALFKLEPRKILDLGSGTGIFTNKLSAIYPKANIFELDIAEGMVMYAKKQRNLNTNIYTCCADSEILPFPDHCFDLIFSNCAMQWANNLDILFSELHRVLSPQGVLLFTTMGPDTLQELKSAWRSVDLETHVHDFQDMHHWGDRLLFYKFVDPVVDVEKIIITYDSVDELLQDLKQTGAHNLSAKRPKYLISKHKLLAMKKNYEQLKNQDKNQNNLIPATYEIIYGHALGADLIQRQKKCADGSVEIPISSLTSLDFNTA